MSRPAGLIYGHCKPKLKDKLKEIEHQRDLDEITQQEFEIRKNKLLTEFFD